MIDTPLRAEFRYMWKRALRTGRQVAELRLWAVKIGCEDIVKEKD